MPIIAPIYPDLGNYINAIFMLSYSAILFYNISKPTRKEEEETINTYKKNVFFYLERAFLIVVVLIIFLVSGAFKYSISAIASDSMYPALKRGDAIILEKTDEDNIDTLKKGMIVAYEQDGQIVTHRILTIELNQGKEYIITKGDNNSTKDVQKKTKDDIIGIVRFRIPYIGYPSVEISEIKNK
jgi:signal peptidase